MYLMVSDGIIVIEYMRNMDYELILLIAENMTYLEPNIPHACWFTCPHANKILLHFCRGFGSCGATPSSDEN